MNASARAALRWRPTVPIEAPFRIEDDHFSAALPGAFVPAAEVLEQYADDPGTHLVGVPYDFTVITAAPASGTTTTLIGTGASVSFGPVPSGYRAGVFGIWPYLEGAAGPVSQARIPGAGVTMQWRLLVDGQPRFPYHNITTIFMPWGSAPTDRPLLEVPQRRTLSLDVTNTDPAGLYAFLGVRLLVRWIPWKMEWR